jgi:hypothetical protein
MVGAMGLDDPNKLAPHHIWRRVEDESMRYFDEIYNSLAENEQRTARRQGRGALQRGVGHGVRGDVCTATDQWVARDP